MGKKLIMLFIFSYYIRSSFEFSTISKVRRDNGGSVSYALDYLRNEMKNSFLSDSDNFLEKRLLAQKRVTPY